MRTLYHLVRADFLERVRHSHFLCALGLILVGGYLLVPPAGASYMVGLHPVELETLTYYRGVYNSAWVGSIVAAMTTWLLSLFGFYLVKGSIERDQRTGVGQLIAASPLSKVLYIVGKWVGNVAVLVVLAVTMAVAAGAMQLLRGEDHHLQLAELLAPFLWLTLPPVTLVAALSVLFETVPRLGGGLGNLMYAMSWFGLLPVSFTVIGGLNLIESSVLPTLTALYPLGEFRASQGVNPAWYGSLHTFRWHGIQWTPETILLRLVWLGAALLVVILAVVAFAHSSASLWDGVDSGLKPKGAPSQTGPSPVQEAARVPMAQQVSLTALPSHARRYRFNLAWRAELRLALKGQPWWWYIGALGWIAAGLMSPIHTVREFVLPAAWLWPVLVWSAMGTREARHGTEDLVFSLPHPLSRHLPAIWLSGIAVTMLAGSGVGLRLALGSEWSAVLAWASGALFIPTLALALGLWSSSSKVFEALYMVLWYVGPVNRLKPLDYMGASQESAAQGIPCYYLALTVILLGFVVVGRKRQIGW